MILYNRLTKHKKGAKKMSSNAKLLSVYMKLFEHKDLLSDIQDKFLINPQTLTQENLTFETIEQIEKITAFIVSYLLSGVNVYSLSHKALIEKIRQGYENQDFWYNLLLDYVDFLITKDKEELVKEEKELLEGGKVILKQIFQQEYNEKKIIETFAQKIEKEGFHVDGKRLVANYLKMRKIDATMAWQVLTENPAFFAPIKTKDAMGGVALSQKDAIEENKRLAKFLKKLKV